MEARGLKPVSSRNLSFKELGIMNRHMTFLRYGVSIEGYKEWRWWSPTNDSFCVSCLSTLWKHLVPLILVFPIYSSRLVLIKSINSHFVPRGQHSVSGTSLVVQWLRLQASTTERWVQFLLGELRSHMLYSIGKALKTKQSNSVSVTCIYKYFHYLLLLPIIITSVFKGSLPKHSPVSSWVSRMLPLQRGMEHIFLLV